MPNIKSKKEIFVVFVWLAALIVTGMQPKEYLTWVLEIFPIIIAAPVLIFTRKDFALPTFLLFWICVHGIILAIGGHYTYAEVPLGFWVQDLFHFSRNHYDRLGHFFQGFVPALVAKEILTRKAQIRSSKWIFFLAVTIAMSISVTYEFIEWAAALILNQGADAFLGTQGDPWDTQWDMFMATVGAITSLAVYRNRSPGQL